MKEKKIITKAELFALVRKSNGLRGRQAITGYWSDCADAWIFDSNVRGGYGETETYHYKNDECLLNDIAPAYKTITKIGMDVWELN